MANDRVYIQCKGCEETVLLFKFWGGGEIGPVLQAGAVTPYVDEKLPEQCVEETTRWLEKHLQECREAFGNDLGSDPGFDLVTEATAHTRDEG